LFKKKPIQEWSQHVVFDPQGQIVVKMWQKDRVGEGHKIDNFVQNTVDESRHN
jgi:hypothetical protein